MTKDTADKAKAKVKGKESLKGKEGGAEEAKKQVSEEPKPQLSVSQKLYQDLLKNIEDIEEGVRKKDRNKLSAVSKHNKSIRSVLSARVLRAVFDRFTILNSDLYAFLHKSVNSVHDVEMVNEADTFEPIKVETPVTAVTPEVEAYLRILSLLFAFDKGEKVLAEELSVYLINWLDGINRRTMDMFSAKAYFFYSLCHEVNNKLPSIRPKLLTLHRSACLRHDEPGQAMLINLILRNFLESNLVNQADQFLLNSAFPDNHSNYQYARYLYYMGRINVVQLNYSDAFDHLSQVIRRAPQTTATGFREHAYKLLIIVQLLIGEIPDRSIFRTKGLQRALKPYFSVAQSVRVGDLSVFIELQNRYKNIFVKDRTYNLIVRLRHNVIKAGLRKISLSYSRISIADIAKKLSLNSVADAEYVIAKAIHDGAMDATIDREKGFIYSKENPDFYSSKEPAAAFHRRIKFCLDIHNEAVKSMRFPDERAEAEKEDFLAEGEVDIEILDDKDGDDDFME